MPSVRRVRGKLLSKTQKIYELLEIFETGFRYSGAARLFKQRNLNRLTKISVAE